MPEAIPKKSTRHEMRVYADILPFLRNGSKKYELRVARESHKKIQVGDILDFGQGVVKKVSKITRFDSPEAVLATILPEELLPGSTESDLLNLWKRKIDPTNDSARLGILAFELSEVK